MAVYRPIGFQNFHQYFVRYKSDSDATAKSIYVTCSFFIKTATEFQFYRGASVQSATNGNPAVITTGEDSFTEAHGLRLGQPVYLDGVFAVNGGYSVLNGGAVVNDLISPTEFTIARAGVPVSTSVAGVGSGSAIASGVVGVLVPGYFPIDNIESILRGPCILADYPAPWERPLEG